MIKNVDLPLERVVQSCGVCARENSLDARKLRLGVAVPAPGGTNANLINLPACGCGAAEVLVRTFARHFQSGRPSPHHLAVNVLAEHLRAHGRVVDQLKTDVANEAERTFGSDVLAGHVRFTPETLYNAWRGAQPLRNS